jgi:hypothetical protein
MIRYDWQKLREYPIDTTLKVMFALTNTKLLKEQPREVLYPISTFRNSSSFLVNPEDLILNRKKYTSAEIFLYLELASQRSYIKYKRTGSVKLPTYFILNKDINDSIIFNNLLDKTEEEIIFLYEEN